MLLRPKLFLTFALITAMPLLLLSGVGLLYATASVRTLFRSDLDRDLALSKRAIESALKVREQKLTDLAKSRAVFIYAHGRRPSEPNASVVKGVSPSLALSEANPAEAFLKDSVTLPVTNKSFSFIGVFSPDGRMLFGFDGRNADSGGPVPVSVGRQVLENELQQKVWHTRQGETVCVNSRQAEYGQILRCATPIIAGERTVGALAGDIRLDKVFMETAEPIHGTNSSIDSVIVLDRQGYILHHKNEAVKYQNVRDALPEFAPVANAMADEQSGQRFYLSNQGEHLLAAYTESDVAGLSIALIRSYTTATASVHRWGWFTVAIAGLVGLVLAALLTHMYQRKEQSIERITAGVTALAKGELNLHIDARSRDDIRKLAEGVNLVKDRLREQLAREAEVRQIESFLRLSAMLTHDLKNAISGLSLLVQNMERRFTDENFRVDAMAALREETENLKGLVERISNPITALSGEYKQPGKVDLIPIIRRVLARQDLGRHELNLDLPTAVVARVDSERIEKVFENLVLNALEAMNGKPGTLTILAGRENPESVYFSIGDTGIGMTKKFIEQKLFRPFATTKEKGMGLGLYTCREVVQANGGTIDVTSKPGSGTTFRVVLTSPASDEMIDQ